MHPSRILLALALILALIVPGVAAAQPYPSKAVRLIVPYPVGTANEVFARVVAQKLSELWKVPVVVEAIPGAGGVVGTQVLVKAPADGYTLGWVSSPHAINPALYPTLPYDSIKDFRPIVNIASTPLVFVASPSFRANSIADLIAIAKAKPGSVNFASNGNGSSSHLATELLVSAAGVKFTHIPYKSTGQMTTDLISGQVDFAALGVITTLPMVQAGKLKALAVTGAKRSSLLPNVPAVAETVPGYETKAWMGIVAPAGVPEAVVTKIHIDVVAITKDPAVLSAMSAQGLDVDLLDQTQFGKRIESDIGMWKRIVIEAGVKVD
jgi:tripartite-type tricarboxylate transporter receptor subunit TctC